MMYDLDRCDDMNDELEPDELEDDDEDWLADEMDGDHQSALESVYGSEDSHLDDYGDYGDF